MGHHPKPGTAPIPPCILPSPLHPPTFSGLPQAAQPPGGTSKADLSSVGETTLLLLLVPSTAWALKPADREDEESSDCRAGLAFHVRSVTWEGTRLRELAIAHETGYWREVENRAPRLKSTSNAIVNSVFDVLTQNRCSGKVGKLGNRRDSEGACRSQGGESLRCTRSQTVFCVVELPSCHGRAFVRLSPICRSSFPLSLSSSYSPDYPNITRILVLTKWVGSTLVKVSANASLYNIMRIFMRAYAFEG
ncbi:hypothetical protein Mapa_005308 [Marchantia paleacea]|nr:hypothetical protein Mapa_005308 [Marchantia paleacea]